MRLFDKLRTLNTFVQNTSVQLVDFDAISTVMSDIARRANVNPAVVVGALNKLESAGILVSQSLGKKGTRVKLCNAMFSDELARQETMKEL